MLTAPLLPRQVWQDSRNKIHYSEPDAVAAEKQYLIEDRLKPIAKDKGQIDLAAICGYNVEALQPIVDYFNNQMAEATKRMERRGST